MAERLLPFRYLLSVAILVSSNISTITTLAASISDQQWHPRTGYSEDNSLGRHHPITFANESHGFLLTGSTLTRPATNDFYIYEEDTDAWFEGPVTPMAARSFGYGVVLPVKYQPKAYLGFGAAENGTLLQDLWEIDMTTLEWKRLADLPGPGRRHPSMVSVLGEDERWKIHVGLGDGQVNGVFQNLKDYWSYDIATDSWEQLPDFPGTPRHHPFYFGLGGKSYTGLGHSDGRDPYIERDFYSFEESSQSWTRQTDFASYQIDTTTGDQTPQLLSSEARVAGTQFSIDFMLPNGDYSDSNLVGSLGFVLSGDGDDHSFMEEGEFHAFYPPFSPLITWDDAKLATSRQTDANSGAWWRRLPPHPGMSRWAPGSFVIRGTARAYFTSGYNRAQDVLYGDLWSIDLSSLFTGLVVENVFNQPDETLNSTDVPAAASSPQEDDGNSNQFQDDSEGDSNVSGERSGAAGGTVFGLISIIVIALLSTGIV